MTKHTEFYHVTHLPLRAGSIIEPGNFGRIINSYRTDRGNPWVLARELVFELVRKESWAHLPSRLNCSFLFMSLEAAHAGFDALNGELMGNRIYRAELVEPDAPSHVADFSLVRLPQGTEFLHPMMTIAERYWRGDQIAAPEYLTTSPIRLLEPVIGDGASYLPTPSPKP